MAFFVRPLNQHEERVIRDLLERYHNDTIILKRLNIILLSHQRMKSGEIGRQLQITPSTIVHWIKRFNQLGLNCFEHTLARDPIASPAVVPESEPLYVRPLSSIEIEAVQEFIERYRERSQTMRRFQTILLSNEGITVSEIVRTLNLSQKTVHLWIKQFNSYGLSRLETFGDKNWLLRQQKIRLVKNELPIQVAPAYSEI